MQPTSNPPSARTIDYATDPQVKQLVERCIRDSRKNTAALDRYRQDMQNLLMHRGGPDNQWTVWNSATNRYERRPYDDSDEGLPAWIPRATSNVFANKVDGIIAILNQAAPAQAWEGTTNDDEDKAAAEVVGDCMPALLEEIGYAKLRQRIHQLIALTDKVAVTYYFDNDEKYGLAGVDLLRCPACGLETTPMAVEDAGDACPACGQQDGMETALGADGAPQQTQYPIGKLCAHLHSSFEFSLPSSAVTADEDEAPWILTHHRMPTEDILRLWGKEHAAFIKQEGHGTSRSQEQRHYADQMRRLSSPFAGATGARSGADQDAGPVVYRLQHDPITDGEFDLPEGLYAVMLGEKILEAGPLPVKDDKGRPRKSILLRTFAPSPGTPFGKPPADDLVPLQQQRNLIETLLLLILMHDAAPTTYVPMSVTLEDEPTGRPGQFVRYRSMVPGERPTTERGTNPPEGLYRFLEMVDQKFDQLSNLNSVLQGARPEGDPTLGEIEILQERGQAAFKTPLDGLATFEERQARLLLWIARQSLWTPRFRRIEGSDGGWKVDQFLASDLMGNVDVRVDPASAWPRSPLATQMRLGKAMEMGVLIPAQDPEVGAEVLEQLGLAEFKPSLDIDRKQIARELDKWRAARTPDEIAPPKPFDNLPLHLHLKQNFMKTEDAELLAQANQPVYMAMLNHVQLLQMTVMQQQAAQAMAAGGGAPAPEPTRAQGGDDGAVREAVESGVLQPKGAQADPMQELVSSGMLQPAADAAAAQQAQAPSIDDLVAQRVMTPVPPQGQAGPM